MIDWLITDWICHHRDWISHHTYIWIEVTFRKLAWIRWRHRDVDADANPCNAGRRRKLPTQRLTRWNINGLDDRRCSWEAAGRRRRCAWSMPGPDCQLRSNWKQITSTPFLFYKNTFYKNIQAEIPEKKRTSIRTYPALILDGKYFFSILGSKFVMANTKSYCILFNFTSFCNLG